MVMQSTHLLIVGLTRNGEQCLERSVHRLIDATRNFGRVSWLIVESDSDDRTIAVLDKLGSSVRDFRYVSLGRLSDTIPKRTARIAHCRNAYLDEIRTSARYQDVDYVLVSDTDGINDLVEAAHIDSCFTRDDWDVCASNRRGPYYDIFALRHPDWCPGDAASQVRFLTSYGVSDEKAAEAAVFSRMITIGQDSPWIEVESAFGGMAIYRAATLRRTADRYTGVHPSGTEVCEHVPFHEGLRRSGAKLFINPAFVSGGPCEYTRARAWHRKFYRQLLRNASRIKKKMRAR